jgi:uncharacterized protein (UPF0276 family)
LQQGQHVAFAVDVIAHRDAIDAPGQQLMKNRRRHAASAGSVLGVADDKLNLPPLDQARQMLGQHRPSGFSDHITYTQNRNRHRTATFYPTRSNLIIRH